MRSTFTDLVLPLAALVAVAFASSAYASFRPRLHSGGRVPVWSQWVPLAYLFQPTGGNWKRNRLLLDFSTLAVALVAALGSNNLVVGMTLSYVWAMWAVAGHTDLRVFRLPDRLTLLAALGAAVTAFAMASDVVDFLATVGIGLTMTVVMFAMWWFAPNGMGFGDVMLSLSTGIVAAAFGGWVGVIAAFLAMALSGLLAALLLAVAKRGGVKRSTRIPFGPHMIVGAAVVIAIGLALFSQGYPLGDWTPAIEGALA